MAKTLTDIAVRNLRPGSARREVPDAGARGLRVVVQPSGVKSFAVRFRFRGRMTKLTLGPVEIGLAAARKLAADALFELAQDRDPAERKRQAKQAERAIEDSLGDIAKRYLRIEAVKLRSAGAIQRTFDRLILPALGTRPIADIRRSEIVRLLDKVADENGPVMADRTLAIIARIMSWHAGRSDDFRTPVVRSMRRTKASEQRRDRILNDDELAAVWRAADASADGPFGAFVKFLLLTAARRNEAAHMRWAELSGSDWTLPAARNKTKVDCTRPVSKAAQQVLAQTPKIGGSPFVFSTDGRQLGGFTRRKRAFDAVCGVTGWTLHDLRRTARSLMSRAGVPVDHAERCLGHVVGGVRGVYDRHKFADEMLHAFEALAAQIERIVSPHDNVTALPARSGHAR